MGGWIQTRSGRWIDPLDPRPEDFDLSDVAHALAMVCRFNGHCRRFYSVAEHSVHVSRLCPPEHALWGLLHDAAEAYLSDLPGPVKKRMPDYSAAERKLLAALCARFGLTAEMPEAVRQADRVMLANERDQLMPPSAEPWPGLLSRWPHVAIACDAPPEASIGFLRRYEELMNLCGGHR